MHVRAAALTAILLVVPTLAQESTISGIPVTSVWNATTVVAEGGLVAAPRFDRTTNGFEGSAEMRASRPGEDGKPATSLVWTIGTVADLEAGLEGDAPVPAGCDVLVRTRVVSGDREATGWTAVHRSESGRIRPIPLGVRDGEGRFYPTETPGVFRSSLFGCVGLSDVWTTVIIVPAGEGSTDGDPSTDSERPDKP